MMINKTILFIALLSAVHSAYAETIAEAVAEGQSFGKSTLPSSNTKLTPSGSNVNNSKTTSSTTPLYNANQPKGTNYTSGIGLFAQGTGAISTCKNYVPTGDRVADQECAGVNFLAKNPIQTKFVIQPNDPSLLAAQQAVLDAKDGSLPGSQCVIKTVVTSPAVYSVQTCAQAAITDNVACNNILSPVCGYGAKPISSSSTTQSGGLSAWISGEASPGTYTFGIGGGGCSNSGWGQINFYIDTIGMGSFININLNSIDDAGAVAVNDIPVWAGYPNAGPSLYSADLGNQQHADFALGYSWMGETYTTSGGYFGMPLVTTVTIKQLYAPVKLLDYCPAGYTPIGGLGYGLFCNSEGKFLMTGHEGIDPRAVALGQNMPIKQGLNTIKVFWGTSAGGCGELAVTGTIHNIGPICSSTWTDGCSGARGAL